MRYWTIFILLFCFSAAAFAGMLPGGIKGSLEIKYEDDTLDDDLSLVVSKIKFERPSMLGALEITPYIYFEDESYKAPLSAADNKETESALGFDLLAFKNDALKVKLGLEYQYENNASSDNDALLIYKLKADF
jgi:hypothetical protein